MSIYIDGIEMPTSPVLFCVHPDGKVFAYLEDGCREYKAVPVPPDLRLIDADTVYRFAKDQLEKETGAFSKGFNKAMRVIMAAAKNRDAFSTVSLEEPRTIKWREWNYIQPYSAEEGE